jgi:hypothetical protein
MLSLLFADLLQGQFQHHLSSSMSLKFLSRSGGNAQHRMGSGRPVLLRFAVPRARHHPGPRRIRCGHEVCTTYTSHLPLLIHMIHSTLAISVHTFVVIFFSWHPPAGAEGARIWGTVIGTIWLYLGLCVSVGECRYQTMHRALANRCFRLRCQPRQG